jgi:hypothetical protein
MRTGPAPTQVRVAPPSRERLIQLAKAGHRIASQPGPLHSPRIAAICEALIMSIAQLEALRHEVATLRQRLAEAHGWGDEPTRKSDAEYPVLVARTTRIGLEPK